MNKITTEAIRSLLESDDTPVASLYLPTHRAPTPAHIQEDKIRFKNLIKAVREQLGTQGVDDTTIRKIGNQLEDLYGDEEFWRYTTEGLAVFCSLSGIQSYSLPMECNELADAGSGYHLTPLIAALSYDQPYYVLALAVYEPTLYLGDMYGLNSVEIDFPESPEAALNIDEMFSNSRTVRAGSGYGPGSPSSGSHGQGDSRQAGQEERLSFFRIIDTAIAASDQVDATVPLLIAGLEGDVSDYRGVSQYGNLVESSLIGNYTLSSGVSLQDLHLLSWPLIEQELGGAKRAGVLESFNELHGTGLSSIDESEVKAAAEEGRVDTLLLGILKETRDVVKDGNEAVLKLVFSEAYEKSGVDAIGRDVLGRGGEVVALFQDAMPEGAMQAALYRY